MKMYFLLEMGKFQPAGYVTLPEEYIFFDFSNFFGRNQMEEKISFLDF